MMLKRDYEKMTKALVEYLDGMKGQSTGYVPTTQAKEEVLRTVRVILEAYGVEVEA